MERKTLDGESAADVPGWDEALAALEAAVFRLRAGLRDRMLPTAAVSAHREAVVAIRRLQDSTPGAATGDHLEQLRRLHRDGQGVLEDLRRMRGDTAGELAATSRDSQTLRFLESSGAGDAVRHWTG